LNARENMDRTLRWLLSQARIGPALRLPAMQALGGRRPEAIRGAGRAIVRALIRRGDLIRVRIEGESHAGSRDVFALRGHTALLDLTPFLGEAPHRSYEPAASAPMDEAVAAADLLDALERVQELPVTSALHDGGAAWLETVLTVLDDVLPGCSVHLDLHDPSSAPDNPDHVFHTPPEDLPFWARIRREGESCRLHRRLDLPPHLRGDVGRDGTFLAQVTPLLAPEPDPAGGAATAEAGLLYLLTESRPADELVKLGRRLSRFVAQSWRQRLHMERMIHTDPLTGVHNRAFYDSQIVVELERSRRNKTPLALLLGDLDHFKQINDTHGHPTGDRVLRTVAREMQDGLRRIDLVCRWGGEEFILILPDTDLEAAREVVTRLQVRIANLRLSDPAWPEPLRVTVSFGGVIYPEGGSTPEELYDLADEMLYLSKQRGRNRCHFWRPDGEPLLSLPQYREG